MGRGGGGGGEGDVGVRQARHLAVRVKEPANGSDYV